MCEEGVTSCPDKPYYTKHADSKIVSADNTMSGVTSGKLDTEAAAEEFCRYVIMQGSNEVLLPR
jgi:hypothetical protein